MFKLEYLYKGCIDMEAYNEKGIIIPHGPGTLYTTTGQLQQGMFKKGKLDGLGMLVSRRVRIWQISWSWSLLKRGRS